MMLQPLMIEVKPIIMISSEGLPHCLPLCGASPVTLAASSSRVHTPVVVLISIRSALAPVLRIPVAPSLPP